MSLLLQSSRSSPQHYQKVKEGDESVTGNAISNDQITVKNQKDESRTVFSNRMHRKLQFDGMFENIQAKGLIPEIYEELYAICIVNIT